MSNEDSVQRTLGYLERLLEEQAKRHVSREEDRPMAWEASAPQGEPRGEAAPDEAVRRERRLDDADPEDTADPHPRSESSAPTPERQSLPPEQERTVPEDETATTSPSTDPQERDEATVHQREPGGDRPGEAAEAGDAEAGDVPPPGEPTGEAPAAQEARDRRAETHEPPEPATPEPNEGAGAREPAEVAAELARGRRGEASIPEATDEHEPEGEDERDAAADRAAIDENETTLEMPPLQEGAPPADDTVERPSRGGNGVQPYRRLTTRLGTLLVDEGLISSEALDRALSEHRTHGERLGHYLVDEGLVREADLVRVLARQYGVPAAELDSVDVDEEVLDLVPVEMARRYLVVPVATRGGALDVAMVDPTDVVAMANLKFATGLRPQALIATERAVLDAIRRLYQTTGVVREPEPEDEELGPRDLRRELRHMILARDQAVMDLETDPRAAYRLAVQVDDLVEDIIALVGGHLDEPEERED